ncbi:MAG: hypothetical protein ACC618_02780 [Patescibacteria group bacterium]
MTESDPTGKNQNEEISDFDRLVGVAVSLNQKATDEGRTPRETPELDNYINQRKKQAGSPRSALKSK